MQRSSAFYVLAMNNQLLEILWKIKIAQENINKDKICLVTRYVYTHKICKNLYTKTSNSLLKLTKDLNVWKAIKTKDKNTKEKRILNSIRDLRESYNVRDSFSGCGWSGGLERPSLATVIWIGTLELIKIKWHLSGQGKAFQANQLAKDPKEALKLNMQGGRCMWQ